MGVLLIFVEEYVIDSCIIVKQLFWLLWLIFFSSFLPCVLVDLGWGVEILLEISWDFANVAYFGFAKHATKLAAQLALPKFGSKNSRPIEFFFLQTYSKILFCQVFWLTSGAAVRHFFSRSNFIYTIIL